MPVFRITEEVATVSRIVYQVTAPNEDEVEDYLDREQHALGEPQILNKHVEIIHVDEIEDLGDTDRAEA